MIRRSASIVAASMLVCTSSAAAQTPVVLACDVISKVTWTNSALDHDDPPERSRYVFRFTESPPKLETWIAAKRTFANDCEEGCKITITSEAISKDLFLKRTSMSNAIHLRIDRATGFLSDESTIFFPPDEHGKIMSMRTNTQGTCEVSSEAALKNKF